jgi:hypothetical protein
VWIQNRTAPYGIWVYDPDTGTDVTYAAGAIPDPYSYSDFTGYNRNVFTMPSNAEFFREYGVDDPACAPGLVPSWGDLTFSAITVNSYIEFYAQVASDPGDLALAPHISLGTTPPDASPIYVNDLIPLNQRFLPYIRITAALRSIDGSTSPVLGQMGLDWACVDAT